MSLKNERFEMRLDEEILKRVDRWRTVQVDLPSRAEAMRRLVELGLARNTGEGVSIGDGEKLILMLIGDLYKHLKLDCEDVDFINKMIGGGHYWAAKWQYTGIFHDHEDKPQDLSLVLDILDMWDRIESSYEKLSKKDKAFIETNAAPLGKYVNFRGFDGNHESAYLSIAIFLVNDMERFTRFAGRDLNAHMRTLDSHQRMLAAFAPMRSSLAADHLTAAQVITLLRVQPHPESRAAIEMLEKNGGHM